MAMIQKVRDFTEVGLAKARKTAELFGDGFKQNAGSDFDIGVSTVSGIWTGLKYKGSVKNGVKAGAATYLSLRCVSGLQNVINNWHEVRRIR